MKRGFMVFLEGETEEELYQGIISFLRNDKLEGHFKLKKLHIHNLKGIGNFKLKLLGKAEKINSNNPDIEYTVFLCYDTDVFGLGKKPPVDWSHVESRLKQMGIKKIIHLKADKSIEDWLLCDLNGLCSYLKLSKKPKLKGRTGYEKICNLFRASNRVYTKGSKASGLISKLDVGKITCSNCDVMSEFCKELGVNCDNTE